MTTVTLNLNVVGERVAVEKINPETVSAGGIIIPDIAEDKAPCLAKVVAVGKDSGAPLGSTVVFDKFSGIQANYGGRDLWFIQNKDLVAIVEDSSARIEN